MFFTFEGIDGCGKSTQIILLKGYLEQIGYDVITLREPGGTDFSEKLRSLLLESNHEISSVTELLLFEAARNHLVESIIKPAIESGKVVLSDRFYDSTTAYQGYGRGLPVDMVETLNNFASDGVKPDLTFYLQIDLKEAEKRSNNRKKDRIESSGENFFTRVKKGFENISEKDTKRIKIIDSSKDINNTHIEILKHVRNFINK